MSAGQRTRTGGSSSTNKKEEMNFPTKAILAQLVREDEDDQWFVPLAHERFVAAMRSLKKAGLERDRAHRNAYVPYKQLGLTFLGKHDLYEITNRLISFSLAYVDWDRLMMEVRVLNKDKADREQAKEAANKKKAA